MEISRCTFGGREAPETPVHYSESGVEARSGRSGPQGRRTKPRMETNMGLVSNHGLSQLIHICRSGLY